MSGQFQWHTDDENEWEAAPQGETKTNPPGRRYSLLAALLLAGLAALVLVTAVNRRVDQATTAVSQDIDSSINLLIEAGQRQDRELFDTVLSGSRRSWTAAQQTLFQENLLWDRWTLGLNQPVGSVPEIISVEISPDLRAAEVWLAHRYRADKNNMDISLRQPLVFRRGVERWLLAPPRAEFWGEWQTAHGRLLSLVYPERDAAIARRLLLDLDRRLADMCAGLADIRCPGDFHLFVQLDTDPASLAATAHPSAMLAAATTLDLPAPSLVGVPVDEAGYQAVATGYARHVVGAAIAQLVAYECCQKGLFFQALLALQLQQLGLQDFPLQSADYSTLVQHPFLSLRDLARYWALPPEPTLAHPAWRQVFAFVSYLADHNNSVPAATVQRGLARQDDYLNWVQTYLPEIRRRGVNQGWLQYVQSRLPLAAAPVPAQDIVAICDPGSGLFQTLFRYRPATGEWTAVWERRPFLFMSPLPDDNGVLLELQQMRPDQPDLYLWKPGQAPAALAPPLNGNLFRVDTNGDHLVLYDIELSRQLISFYLLDSQACAGYACAPAWQPGVPVMAPDGRHTFIAGKNGILWMGDSKGQDLTPIAAGTAPFWLDAGTFGFVRPAQGLMRSLTEIVLVDLDTRDDTVWLNLENILADLQTGLAADQVTIRAVAPSPAAPDLIFIAVSVLAKAAGASGGDLILVVHRRENRLVDHMRLENRFGLYNPLRFSPDGRWLTVRTYQPKSDFWQLHIYDAGTGSRHTFSSRSAIAFPGDDWSADGKWLLRLEDGYFHLFHPSSGSQHLIIPETEDCDYAAWIDPL